VTLGNVHGQGARLVELPSSAAADAPAGGPETSADGRQEPVRNHPRGGWSGSSPELPIPYPRSHRAGDLVGLSFMVAAAYGAVVCLSYGVAAWDRPASPALPPSPAAVSSTATDQSSRTAGGASTSDSREIRP
jgi:hypothetical protein